VSPPEDHRVVPCTFVSLSFSRGVKPYCTIWRKTCRNDNRVLLLTERRILLYFSFVRRDIFDQISSLGTLGSASVQSLFRSISHCTLKPADKGSNGFEASFACILFVGKHRSYDFLVAWYDRATHDFLQTSRAIASECAVDLRKSFNCSNNFFHVRTCVTHVISR